MRLGDCSIREGRRGCVFGEGAAGMGSRLLSGGLREMGVRKRLVLRFEGRDGRLRRCHGDWLLLTSRLISKEIGWTMKVAFVGCDLVWKGCEVQETLTSGKGEARLQPRHFSVLSLKLLVSTSSFQYCSNHKEVSRIHNDSTKHTP